MQKLEQSVEDFEARLTPENLRKIYRYMTQCIEGLQTEMALFNLATDVYKGLPFSNSVLLHELKEAEEFDRLKCDYSSDRLETMSDEERSKIKEELRRKYREIRLPHLTATIEQYTYLTAVAKKRGYPISTGTLIRFHPFTINLRYPPIKEIVSFDPTLRINLKEVDSAIQFMLVLNGTESEYRIFFKNKQD